MITSGIMFLQETLTGGIQSVFRLLEEGTLSLFHRLLRNFGLFFFSLLAAVFLLIGLARFLNGLYQIPGLGETIVGAFIFAGILFVYMIDRHTHQQ